MFETELKTERACFQYILVKNLPSNEDLIPGLGRCPGVENDILAGKISWTEPGSLQAMESQRVTHDLISKQQESDATEHLHITCEKCQNDVSEYKVKYHIKVSISREQLRTPKRGRYLG